MSLAYFWVPPDISRLSLITRSGGEREAQLRPAGGDVTWLLTGIFTFEKEEEFSRNLSHSLLLSSRAAALFELPISTRELFTLISRCKDSQKYWVSFWPDLVRIYSCGSFSPSLLCLQSTCKLCKAKRGSTLNRSNFPIALDSDRTMNHTPLAWAENCKSLVDCGSQEQLITMKWRKNIHSWCEIMVLSWNPCWKELWEKIFVESNWFLLGNGPNPPGYTTQTAKNHPHQHVCAFPQMWF